MHMSYMVSQVSDGVLGCMIGSFAPDTLVLVVRSSSISVYTLGWEHLKTKVFFDQIFQAEKCRIGDRDGVAVLFGENKMSFLRYDATTNDFHVHGLKCFSAYRAEDSFFRINGDMGFLKLNDLHFAIFHVTKHRDSIVFSFRKIKNDLRNVFDACFLDFYRLPTLCFLHTPHIRKYTCTEGERVLTASLDLESQKGYALYSYMCAPQSFKLVALQNSFATISRNFITFYKNEFLAQVTTLKAGQDHLDRPGVSVPQSENGNDESCREASTERGATGDNTCATACEETCSPKSMARKFPQAEGIFTVHNVEGDNSKPASRCFHPLEISPGNQTPQPRDIEADLRHSEFLVQKNTLEIVSDTGSVLIVLHEDLHKIYDFTIFDIEYVEASSAEKIVINSRVGATATRLCCTFGSLLLVGDSIFKIKDVGKSPDEKMQRRTVEKICEASRPYLRLKAERTGVNFPNCSGLYTANGHICLSREEESVIDSKVHIKDSTVGFFYHENCYYRVSGDYVDVFDSSFSTINTFRFTDTVYEVEMHRGSLLVLGSGVLTIRNVNMETVGHTSGVSCFCINDFLVVAAGSLAQFLQLYDMKRRHCVSFESLGSVLKICDCREDGACQRNILAKGKKKVLTCEIAEIESIGSWERLCLAVKTVENDFAIYRRSGDFLYRVEANFFPIFLPGKSFFKTVDQLIYVKSELPLIICAEPFFVQRIDHFFSFLCGEHGLLGNEVVCWRFVIEKQAIDPSLVVGPDRVNVGQKTRRNHDGAQSMRAQENGARKTASSRGRNRSERPFRSFAEAGKNISASSIRVGNALYNRVEHTPWDIGAGNMSADRIRKRIIEVQKGGARHLVVVTVGKSVFFKEKIDPQAEAPDTEDEVVGSFGIIGARNLQFYIEFCSSEFQPVNEYALLKDEYINEIRVMEVNDIQSRKGKSDFLVVCTSFVKSEDWQFKGRLLLFEIIEVNPMESKPWTNRKMKIFGIENCKGPVLDCTPVRGNIACCIGTKLMVFEVDRNEGINAIAFHDLQILATKIRAIKNYVFTGDMANGVAFLYFQAKPFKIHQIATSPKFSCDQLEIFVHKNKLSIVSYGDGMFRIYTYSPGDVLFNRTELIERCRFRSLGCVRIVFLDSAIVEKLYFSILQSLVNTCGIVPESLAFGEAMQPISVKPPVYCFVLREFLSLDLITQTSICEGVGIQRRDAILNIKRVLHL